MHLTQVVDFLEYHVLGLIRRCGAGAEGDTYVLHHRGTKFWWGVLVAHVDCTVSTPPPQGNSNPLFQMTFSLL
jgi:hypothetical protein